ncbi:DUF2218 domain-containing protein [Paracoccus sp. R86501]|uniref:DUF2218 domain-containing protein n=1 Tax=Paracoccus sp. R86501 TaxID=3101711 RepID=UPI00366FC770
MQMTADFATERATGLMTTMGKHFGHKIPVTMADDHVILGFEMGDARIATTTEGLHLSLQGSDAEALERLRGVVESHLLRFAQRDDPAPLAWSAPA